MAISLTLSEVPNLTPYVQYVASGGQTVFPYPFPITQDADLIVVVNGVTLNTDSGYTLSGQGNDTGGNLTFTLGQTAGAIVTLFRDIPIERVTQFGQNSGFSSVAFNAEFNNLYLIAQQIEAQLGQALQIPNTNNPAPVTTLTAALYASKYLAFDQFGNPTPAVLTSLGTITSAILAPFLHWGPTPAEITSGALPVDQGYPPLYARRYGVKFDGVTDDSPAWNKAVAAALATASQFGNLYTGGATVIGDIGVTRCASTIYLASNVRIVGPNLPVGQGSAAFSAVMTPGSMVFLDDIAALNSKLFDTAPFVQNTAVNGDTGTAQAGAASTITLRAGAPDCTGGVITITSGTGAGQTARPIVSQVGVIATVAWPWVTQPDNTSVYSVQGFAVGSRYTAEPGFSNSTHFVPQIALPNLSSTENCGLENFSVFSLRGHKYGIRLLGADHAQVKNIYATGFSCPFEDTGGQINTWENITSDVTNGAFQVGFGWIYESASSIIRQCNAFGDFGVTQPSASNRPWFVDLVSSLGTDPHPEYQTGHYCYQNAAPHFDATTSESVDRCYANFGSAGTTFTACHFERWKHVGYWGGGGISTWHGGSFGHSSSALTAPAFDGLNTQLSIDGPTNVIDFFGGTSGIQIGTFASTFNAHVVIRNLKPVTADTLPSNPVYWDSFPQETIVYCSQQFGDDSNIGAGPSASVATLAEAISRIPEGGAGTIYLALGETDYTVAATARQVGNVTIRKKKIRISTLAGFGTGGQPFVTFPTVAGNVTGIDLFDSQIEFYNVKLLHDATSSGASGNNWMFRPNGQCSVVCTDTNFIVNAPSTNSKCIFYTSAPATGLFPADLTFMIAATGSGTAAIVGDGSTTGKLGIAGTGAIGLVTALKNANTTLGADLTGTWGTGWTVVSGGI